MGNYDSYRGFVSEEWVFAMVMSDAVRIFKIFLPYKSEKLVDLHGVDAMPEIARRDLQSINELHVLEVINELKKYEKMDIKYVKEIKERIVRDLNELEQIAQRGT